MENGEIRVGASTSHMVKQNEMPSLPVIGTIKQDFGWQLHPVYHDWRFNNGDDIVAAAGTPVKAMYGGHLPVYLKIMSTGLQLLLRPGKKLCIMDL